MRSRQACRPITLGPKPLLGPRPTGYAEPWAPWREAGPLALLLRTAPRRESALETRARCRGARREARGARHEERAGGQLDTAPLAHSARRQDRRTAFGDRTGPSRRCSFWPSEITAASRPPGSYDPTEQSLERRALGASMRGGAAGRERSLLNIRRPKDRAAALIGEPPAAWPCAVAETRPNCPGHGKSAVAHGESTA